MSHQPERTEKDCLNCGTPVQGRFCHVCGQENLVTHQSFWALTKHFVYDIFHFDGKFWETLRYLLFKPGYVPKAYVQGRRASFLDPIRMYLFTSAVFFLLFFSLKDPNPITSVDQSKYLTRTQRMDLAMNLAAQAHRRANDSLLQQQLFLLLDSTQRIQLIPYQQQDTEAPISYNGAKYYLKGEAADNDFIRLTASNSTWLERKITHRVEDFQYKYRDNMNEGISEVIDSFLHRIPYLLFLSLPFFALILKLLYNRHKAFFYSDHAVFTLYHYIFSFILLLLFQGLDAAHEWSGWGILNMVMTLLFLSWPLHLYFALKRFYGQGWMKTLGKFLLLNFLGLFVMIVLFVTFVFFSLLLI